MTDIEKKATKAACEYAGLKCPPTEDTGVLTTTDYLTFKDGYIKACEEYESIPKVHGWVARDGDDKKRLCLFTEPPVRIEDMWLPKEDRIYFFLDNSLFPEITWESEPLEIELLIRKV